MTKSLFWRIWAIALMSKNRQREGIAALRVCVVVPLKDKPLFSWMVEAVWRTALFPEMPKKSTIYVSGMSGRNCEIIRTTHPLLPGHSFFLNYCFLLLLTHKCVQLPPLCWKGRTVGPTATWILYQTWGWCLPGRQLEFPGRFFFLPSLFIWLATFLNRSDS